MQITLVKCQACGKEHHKLAYKQASVIVDFKGKKITQCLECKGVLK